MGRKVQSWRRVVSAVDVGELRCVHVPVRQACSICVSGSAACALEGWNLEVCTSLCPWRFLLSGILMQVLSRKTRHLSLSCSLLESGDGAGLVVSFPEGMVSYKPGQELGLWPRIFCWVMWLLQCGFGCKGRNVQSWRRAVPAMDVDDVRCVHVSVRQACSDCVSGLSAHVFEGRNLEVCSSLRPWWIL